MRVQIRSRGSWPAMASAARTAAPIAVRFRTAPNVDVSAVSLVDADASVLAAADIEVDGHRVEAGTMVAVGIYALHRDPALWDNPLVFDPDRFSPENSKGRDRWQYLPFGGGPRSCIGDHFAMLEATLGLATIIRLAEIRSLDNDFPLAVPFTTVAAAPIRARVQPRN